MNPLELGAVLWRGRGRTWKHLRFGDTDGGKDEVRDRREDMVVRRDGSRQGKAGWVGGKTYLGLKQVPCSVA